MPVLLIAAGRFLNYCVSAQIATSISRAVAQRSYLYDITAKRKTLEIWYTSNLQFPRYQCIISVILLFCSLVPWSRYVLENIDGDHHAGAENLWAAAEEHHRLHWVTSTYETGCSSIIRLYVGIKISTTTVVFACRFFLASSSAHVQHAPLCSPSSSDDRHKQIKPPFTWSRLSKSLSSLLYFKRLYKFTSRWLRACRHYKLRFVPSSKF